MSEEIRKMLPKTLELVVIVASTGLPQVLGINVVTKNRKRNRKPINFSLVLRVKYSMIQILFYFDSV